MSNARNDLLAKLVKAQEKRKSLPLSEWVLHERQTMHDAVNHARSRIGRAPVDISEIEHVERRALGSADYSNKFAMYCAELIEQ